MDSDEAIWSKMFEDDGLEEVDAYDDDNEYINCTKEEFETKAMHAIEQEWLRTFRQKYITPAEDMRKGEM